MKINVLNNDGEIEEFSPKRIKESLLREIPNMSEEEATNIKNSVVKQIKDKFESEIPNTTIRTLVNSQLIKRGLVEEQEKSKMYGLSKEDIEKLLSEGCKDNANIMPSPEMIAKYIYDGVMKQYALDSMSEECAEAHKKGYIHIHDLEYFMQRPNCMNWDIRFFLRNQIKVDGVGKIGAVANPSTKLDVAVNHLLEVMGAGSQVLSGGQAFSHFNVFLAPLCKGLSYEEIKQAMQHYIFASNMQGFSRGGQSIFSSVNLEFSIPSFLENEPAVTGGGVIQGVYGDYQEESDLILRAFCSVLKEKDAIGRYFTFPNTIFVIRENTLDEYDWKVQMVHELLSENPTIYFMNCINENSIVMGCRTRLSHTYADNWEYDLLNVGNFHYCTLNLPLIAKESEDDGEFYDKIVKYMKISRDVLYQRRVNVERTFRDGFSNFLLQKDKVTGKPLYDIDRCTFSVGFCGLNEAVQEMGCRDLTHEENYGESVIEFMNEVIKEFEAKDGLRWSLFASPAESTAHRFGMINKSKYDDAIVQGTKGNYYLTNSSHINVEDTNNIPKHIRNADMYHKYTTAGNILHLWGGEPHPDPVALFKLNQKIAKTNTKFWALTNDYTYCMKCGYTIQMAHDTCPVCGTDDVTVMSRITGYYQPVSGYNNGKKEEFKRRNRAKIGKWRD